MNLFKGMKKLFAGLCLMSVLLTCKAVIIVSGDVNIGNGIDGSSGAPVGDNGRFFANVLGNGAKVVLQEGYTAGSAADAYASIASFYSGRGVLVDTISAPVTSSDLAGARLLISAIPLSAYTPTEISLMSSFLGAGNIVFFMGDNSAFTEGAAGNGFINSALSSLGSGLRIVNADDDNGFHTGTGSQIAANPLTAGVNSFVYAAVSEVSAGTPLFFTTSSAPFVMVDVPEPSAGALLLAGLALLWRTLRARAQPN
jgi:hypothetical protein